MEYLIPVAGNGFISLSLAFSYLGPSPLVFMSVPVAEEKIKKPRAKKQRAVELIVVVLQEFFIHFPGIVGFAKRLPFFEQANGIRKIILENAQVLVGSYHSDNGMRMRHPGSVGDHWHHQCRIRVLATHRIVQDIFGECLSQRFRKNHFRVLVHCSQYVFAALRISQPQ
jgi:hypothetical protein